MPTAIPNIIIIILLLLYLFRRKSVWSGLIAIFVYASLHYGHLIFLAATNENCKSAKQCADVAVAASCMNFAAVEKCGLYIEYIHRNSHGWPNLIGAIFLIICCIFMAGKLYKPVETLRSQSFFISNVLISLFLFFMAMTIGALNLSKGMGYSQFAAMEKGIVFSIAMWVCAIYFAIAMKHDIRDGYIYKKDIIIFISILLIVMTASGIYEIATGIFWARVKDALRASAFLFNPNVLGLWCSLMVLLIAFFFHIGWVSRFIELCLMALVAVCLIISGSRSGLLLSLMNLAGISLLMAVNKNVRHLSIIDKMWPSITFFSLFFVFAAGLVLFKSTGHPLAKALCADLQRFLVLPGDLIFVIAQNLHISVSSQFALSSRTIEALDGRLNAGWDVDNLFLSIREIGGYISLILWFWLWSVVLWLGINRLRKSFGIYSSYALIGVIWCLISGFFLRSAQLFPVWILISIVLGVSLHLWLFSTDGKEIELKNRF